MGANQLRRRASTRSRLWGSGESTARDVSDPRISALATVFRRAHGPGTAMQSFPCDGASVEGRTRFRLSDDAT